MEINLNEFLAAFSSENYDVKKLAAKAVLDYRKTRNPYTWNEYMDKLVSLGVSKNRINAFVLNV